MKCPLCNVDLQMTERSGVEIDFCPQCHGVWLDRGELDKIIEISGRLATGSRQAGDEDDDYEDRSRRKHRDQRRHEDDYSQRRKKRGNSLGELFEFGD